MEESGILINEIGKTIVIDGCVELLNNCAFDLVAVVEDCHVCGMAPMSFRDLSSRAVDEERSGSTGSSGQLNGTPGGTRL